jgi:hypothetical protein
MRNNILWQKWIDPFLDEEDEDEDEDDEEQPRWKDSYEEAIERQEKGGHAGPVLVGPMGVIPLNEHNQPSKVFNFWMGHTNFDITAQIKDIIEKTAGVETLEVYTRYRFRMSIGKAFDELEVMDSIKKVLCPAKPSSAPTTKSNIDKITAHLKNKYKYWAIFTLPDGQLDYCTGDTKDKVQKEIAAYTGKAKILTSWELGNENQIATQTSKQ